MATRPVALQMYAVREAAAADFGGVLKRIADMGYAGIECGVPKSMSAAQLADMVAALGLRIAGAHLGFPSPENIERIAADARALGVRRIVTGFGHTEMDTAAAVADCARRLVRACELAGSAGLSLAIHNHWWEFDRQFGGRTPFEMLLSEAPAALSELDIYWCARGGADVAAVAARWSDRIPLLHVKDGDLGPESFHTAVGDGKVPVRRAIEAARHAEWLIVELDNCHTDMFDAVAKSLGWLIGSGLGHGRR